MQLATLQVFHFDVTTSKCLQGTNDFSPLVCLLLAEIVFKSKIDLILIFNNNMM